MRTVLRGVPLAVLRGVGWGVAWGVGLPLLLQGVFLGPWVPASRPVAGDRRPEAGQASRST